MMMVEQKGVRQAGHWAVTTVYELVVGLGEIKADHLVAKLAWLRAESSVAMLVDEKAGTLVAISVVAKVVMSVVVKVAMKAVQRADSWAETMVCERDQRRVETKDTSWGASSAETKADARVLKWVALSALMSAECWDTLKDD